MSDAPQLGRAIPVLPCLDIARAVEFYAARLGFGVCFRFDDYAAVARDGVEIHLWLCKDKKLPKHSGCRIEVRGIESLFDECTQAGVVEPKGALATKSWNVREFAVRDGDGNLITFAEQLAPVGGG
jgi:catechol 2,3-dioxygenase-like lactoylglutathione lyase family enzyme